MAWTEEKVWENCIPLSSAFLRLHHLSSLKSLSMSDVLVSFSFGFCRPLFDKEAREATSLLSLMRVSILNRGERVFVFGVLVWWMGFLASLSLGF